MKKTKFLNILCVLILMTTTLSGCTTKNETVEVAENQSTLPVKLTQSNITNEDKSSYISFNHFILQYPNIDTTNLMDSIDLETLINKEMNISQDTPTILLTSTHSQEIYSDGKSIIEVGNYLANLLENKYQVQTIYLTNPEKPIDQTSYVDMEREVQKVLEENPNIKVMIDIHRDGSPEYTSVVLNGQNNAQILLVNGLCIDPEIGTIGSSKEYENPYIEQNLTFSFKLKEQADQLSSELVQPIYLTPYCYNQNLVPYALHLEIGSNQNTLLEAENTAELFVELLAEILDLKEKPL